MYQRNTSRILMLMLIVSYLADVLNLTTNLIHVIYTMLEQYFHD